MMRNARILAAGMLTLILSALLSAADFFPTSARREAFLRSIEEYDAKYDASEQMLESSFSSPGYHTTLTGGTVHRTRRSLKYAVALLDSGEPHRGRRAEEILRKVISLQDQDPNSRTYGIWPWFLEEPLEQMSPPDWNWADFCGTQLLQVAIDHMHRLPNDLSSAVKESILHAARSIRKRNVGPGYTNIALMGTYVTLVAGERFDEPELRDYGRQRLRRFYDYTQERGSFSEYNSPTYTSVAIEEISRMRQHVRDEAAQKLLEELNEFAWYHVARRFHPPTDQWAGPHSRCYRTLLGNGTRAFLQRGTDDRVEFMPAAEAWESIDAHRIRLACPNDLHDYFTDLSETRVETEAFRRNDRDEHDIIGTTCLHPDFTLGTANIGDLWNQRRPLLAYWPTPAGPAAMRLRCLHDGYDYASASLFTVQDSADLLGAVLFATDRGDTHISLDRLRNSTIRAEDLRLRLQFEGATGDLALPDRVDLDEPIDFTSGPIQGTFAVHAAGFDNLPIRLLTGGDSDDRWIDVVLYQGVEREFDFRDIEEAFVIFTLSLEVATPGFRADAPDVYAGMAATLATADSPRKAWSWQRTGHPKLVLTLPTRPLPTGEQRRASEARLGSADPWKAMP